MVKTILDQLYVGDIERALSKFEDNGCWDWKATKTTGGYGIFYLWRDKRNVRLLAHRVMFALFNGKEPGPILDHLCRNTQCVNPQHLEEVTIGENVRRGNAAKKRTHCKVGHPLDATNTYVYKKPSGTLQRSCRKCDLRRQRQRNSRG